MSGHTHIDVAGRIVRTGRRIILKVTRACWENLRFDVLWERCVTAVTFEHVTQSVPY